MSGDIKVGFSKELLGFIGKCDNTILGLEKSVCYKLPGRFGGRSWVGYYVTMRSADKVDALRDRAQAINTLVRRDRAHAINTLVRKVLKWENLPIKKLDTNYNGQGIRDAERAEWKMMNALIRSKGILGSIDTLNEIRSSLKQVKAVKKQAVDMYDRINSDEPYQESWWRSLSRNCSLILTNMAVGLNEEMEHRDQTLFRDRNKGRSLN